LKALVFPVDAINQNITFQSDDSSIATVTSDGFLTAVSEGLVNVTVTSEEGGFTDTKMINILNPSSEINLALLRPTQGTGTPDGSNVVSNLVDDDTSTRWSVQEFPQSAVIDLGPGVTVTRTELTCHQNRAYQFIIEGSDNLDGPVYDQIGRRVFQKQIKNASSLDVSELQSGIYVLKFEGGGKSFVSKLIKK